MLFVYKFSVFNFLILGGHFGNGVRAGASVPNPTRAARGAAVAPPADPTPTSAGSPGQDGPIKTKGMLKGWSSLAASSSVSKSNERQMKASDTFNAFKRAAHEKQERERQIQEQQDAIRMKKEAAERQRMQADAEKRREREEEEALEQARRAMMLKDVNRPTNHNNSSYSNDSSGDVPANNTENTDAEKARIGKFYSSFGSFGLI